MTISDTCKFEFKANVDRVQEEHSLSRLKAIAMLADELGLLVDTARKMDQRARKDLGQIVPKPEKPLKSTTKPELEKLENPHGGAREGSGRKPKPKEAMLYAKMAIAQLESIQKTHHDRQQAFDYVIKWINKNR